MDQLANLVIKEHPGKITYAFLSFFSLLLIVSIFIYLTHLSIFSEPLNASQAIALSVGSLCIVGLIITGVIYLGYTLSKLIINSDGTFQVKGFVNSKPENSQVYRISDINKISVEEYAPSGRYQVLLSYFTLQINGSLVRFPVSAFHRDRVKQYFTELLRRNPNIELDPTIKALVGGDPDYTNLIHGVNKKAAIDMVISLAIALALMVLIAIIGAYLGNLLSTHINKP